jgi:non-heme chloroperoxidase
LRLTRSIGSEGVVGPSLSPSSASRAMSAAGAQRFTTIGVPALAIYASPHALGPWADASGIDRAKVEAFARFDEGMTERQARWFERTVPGSRVLRLRNASHYVFLSHGDEVFGAIAQFLQTLK